MIFWVEWADGAVSRTGPDSVTTTVNLDRRRKGVRMIILDATLPIRITGYRFLQPTTTTTKRAT